MQLVNLNNSYFLKQNDTATQIKLGVLDYEGNPFPLDTATKVEVVIGVEEGRVLVKEASLLPGIGEIEFGLDEGDLLPAGDNRLEVHIYTSNGEKHIVPSKGYYKLRVQKAIDDLDVQVTTYTLDYFLDQVNKITEGLPETIQEAQRLTEQMQMDLDEVAQLKADAQEAANLSQEAIDAANQIISDMTTVKADAEKATTDANLAATNANNAADNANTQATNAQNAAQAANDAAQAANQAADNANLAAERANSEANYAKAQGDYAKAQAELINEILDQGSVSAVNGKTGNVTLTAEDVGAIPVSEKGVVGGVARLNEFGKVVDASGNEVEGKVKTVNGVGPDENGNIEVQAVASWDTLSDKPSTFPPSAHTHQFSEVVGLQDELNEKANNTDLTSLQQTVTSHLTDYVKHSSYAVASGTNSYTATVDGITQLVEGMSFKIKFTNANTSASTLDINGLGEKPIKKSNGNDLSSGDIKAGQILHLVYTGSDFQLLGEKDDVQITSGDIHVIEPLPVTAHATDYPTGHSVMFIHVNNEYSVGWRESLGLDTSISWYLIVEYFKTISNNGYQKVTAYRLGSTLPSAIFIRNSTGSTSWSNWKRIITSDDITDSTTTDDSTKVASAKAVKTVNDNLTSLQQTVNSHSVDYVKHPAYAVASGSANTYSVTLNPPPTSYVEGMAISVKINVDNTGSSTINVNGLGAKSIKKPNGNNVSAGNLKAGSIYTLRYNGVNFILQGEGGGGGGTAQPGDVLSGKTFTNDSGEQTGTMPNRGAYNITPGRNNITIPAGYHNGSGVVYGDSNLISSNIRQGVSIFGVSGALTVGKRWASGTALAKTVLLFKYADGTGFYSSYVEVTGLNFKPSTILLYPFSSVDAITILYPENLWSSQSYPIRIIATRYLTNANSGTVESHAIRLEGNAYVNQGSFCLPYLGSDWVIKWIAFE